MTRARPLPSALIGRPFRVDEGREYGLTVGRLRGDDLARPFHGVRAGSTPMSHIDECFAYAVKMRSTDFFSHASAARIHGLPLPWRCEKGPIHVTAVLPAGRPRGVGVRGHAVEPSLARVVSVRGVHVSDPVEAWCELASSLTLPEIVGLGDALVQRSNPLATMDILSAAVERRTGRRGRVALSAALPLIRPRTDSWEETALRLDLASVHLPEPEVNGRITDPAGRFIAWGDLVYRQYKVLAEYDGEQHRTDATQYNRDVDRLDDLARAGWRVVRFTKLHRGRARAERIDRVRAALMARAGCRADQVETTITALAR